MRAGDRFERYTIVSLLGEGGMGRVYLARDERLGRQVALKVLPRADDADAVARLLREARAAAAFSHPNVVAVHDVGESGGVPFLVMEYVEGRTLRAAMADAGASRAERVRWLTEIAKALQAAHARGLVHRDVKPENVMIAKDGAVKVLDFGIARLAQSEGGGFDSTREGGLGTLTADGVVVGTPAYMAPEQMLGKPVDARADQFAWGVMACEVLAGRLPWRAVGEPIKMVAEIVSELPAPAAATVGVEPAEVADTIDRALAKQSSARFTSMQALVASLEGTASAPTQAAPSSKPSSTPVATARRERSGRAVAIVGLAVALVAVGAWRRRVTHADGAPAPATSISPRPSSAAKCAPEAAKLFERGVHDYDTVSIWKGNEQWLAATKADPSCAAAWFRLAINLKLNQLPLPDARAYRSHALEGDGLAPEERALLEAMAPYFAAAPDDEAAYRNVAALAERHPDDALIAYYRGVAAEDRGRWDEARAAYQRAAELSPKAAPAVACLALLAPAGSTERERLGAECLARAPHHVWCREVRGGALSHGTDCAAFRAFAEQEVADDANFGAYQDLAMALMASRAPLDSVVEAARASRKRAPVVETPEIGLDVAAYALAGSYDRVDTELDGNSIKEADSIGYRAYWVRERTLVLDDTGRELAADGLFRKTVDALPALSGKPGRATWSFLLGRARRRHALQAPQLAAATLAFDDADRGAAWHGDAFLTEDADGARAHLAKVASLSEHDRNRLVDLGGRYHLVLAQLHATAGEWTLARDEARDALSRCDVATWALQVPRATFLLGEASEKSGDIAGARAAYQTVVDRWGGLKPRAVLAEKAKARLAAMAAR